MPDESTPTEPGKRRAPQKKMSDDDKAKLAEILKLPVARVNGKIDIPSVAALTGFSYQQIYGFIRSDRYWHAQLAEVDGGKLQASEANHVDGDPPADPNAGILMTPTQFSEYQAMIRQQRKMLKADFVALGMTERAGERMEHYQKLGTMPTGMILRATTGQLISNLELLDQVIKADCERVLSGKLPPQVGKDGQEVDPELIERQWRHTIFEGMKLQLSMFSHVHKVQALMARVMADLSKLNGAGKAPEKGVYETDPASARLP